MIEIHAVARESSLPGPIEHLVLDASAPHDRFTTHVLTVGGELRGRTEHPALVRISEGRRALRDVPLHVPPLAEAGPEAGGDGLPSFWASIGVLSLPPRFRLSLHALFEQRPTVLLGSVEASHGPVNSGFEPRRSPLMVTSLGRTGSTWLMRLLAEHLSILVRDRYPYEIRTGRFWMHVLRVLSEPANHSQSSLPGTFHLDPFHLGQNPFFSEDAVEVEGLYGWMGGIAVERLAAFCQENTDTYYALVADHQRDAGARYFAEKHTPDGLQWVTWNVYPGAREIVLVRDPRDMFASMLAFNEKRGFPSFGRERVGTDEEWLRDVRLQVADVVDAWRSRADRAHLVRYEDLIRAPEDTLAGVFRYLDLDATPETVREVMTRASAPTSELAVHRTSESDADSIGRWRRARRWRKVLDSAFADGVEEFGYT